MQTREVVIVEAVRTPIGRGHPEKGYYRDTHANDLLGQCYTEVIRRAGIPAEAVEDVINGCVQQYGEQSMNIGRNAWLQAGLPFETPATTVDRQCGSSQQGINFGAALIATGVHDVVIGSGIEHLGHIPMFVGERWVDDVGTPYPPALMERYGLVQQGLSAEMIADQWDIPREELDEISLRSHQRAAAATAEGRFEREILPFQVNGSTVTTDQGIRADTSLEALAALQPVFREDGRITAGNSSQISDGAAAVMLDLAREGRRARPAAARADPRPDHRRRRPGDHAHRPHPGHAQDPRPQRDDDVGHRPGRGQRGLLVRDRRLAARARPGHGPGQRQRAAPSPSATRSARPAPAWSRRSCTSSSAPTRRSAS